MADKRMFSKTIVDSDAFLDMPQTTQLLYFHLSMRADDDGFINNPRSIIRNVKCSEDDMKILAVKKFIIPFESGIVVIKHWKIHNYIAKDRYHETKYKEEKSLLTLDENNSYTLDKDNLYTECIQIVDEMDTQVRLGKDSIDKYKDKDKKPLANAQTYFDDKKLNDTFIDFMNMRKSLKNGKMTERAVTMMINKLNKHDVNTAIAMLEKSILNNWKDVYDPKQQPKQSTTSKNKFNQFPQREYTGQDYSSLEQALLNKR